MSDHVSDWIVLPIFLVSMFYFMVILLTWPYARPVTPLWIIILCILFPPAFPLLLIFVLATAARPVQVVSVGQGQDVQVAEVIVVEPVRGRVRPALPTRASSSRI